MSRGSASVRGFHLGDRAKTAHASGSPLIDDGISGKCALFLMRQRSHMLEMAQAFVIASTTDPEIAGDPPRVLWVVLADTPHLAVEAARAGGCKVDRIVGTLSEETVERLGLQPDQPRRI
jgi:hypothetical protein